MHFQQAYKATFAKVDQTQCLKFNQKSYFLALFVCDYCDLYLNIRIHGTHGTILAKFLHENDV